MSIRDGGKGCSWEEGRGCPEPQAWRPGAVNPLLRTVETENSGQRAGRPRGSLPVVLSGGWPGALNFPAPWWLPPQHTVFVKTCQSISQQGCAQASLK